MAAFNYSFRAVLASITILSGTALSIAFLSNTFFDSASAANKGATKRNFAAKCERVYSNKSVKALAIEEARSYQQICVCAQNNRELRRQLSAAGVTCTNNQITNFNQPTPSTDTGGPTPPGGPTLGNPGNLKSVGHAGEGPPNATQDSKMNAPSQGGPGDKGASDGV
jgi:hypothetical protein